MNGIKRQLHKCAPIARQLDWKKAWARDFRSSYALYVRERGRRQIFFFNFGRGGLLAFFEDALMVIQEFSLQKGLEWADDDGYPALCLEDGEFPAWKLKLEAAGFTVSVVLGEPNGGDSVHFSDYDFGFLRSVGIAQAVSRGAV